MINELRNTDAEYLKSRAIPLDIAERAGLRSIKGSIAFEYRRRTGLKYYKLRMMDEAGAKSFQRDRKGAETCLFLEHIIETEPNLSEPLVVTEGELDALSLMTCGVPNVVSVPDGAQLDDEGEGRIDPQNDRAFGWLWEGSALKAHLSAFDKIVLAVDDDRKGKILREELAVRFGTHKCFFVTYPEGCKDANEVLTRHGADVLGTVIRNAKAVVPNRLVCFSDLPQMSAGKAYQSGFEGLDEKLKLGFVAPELVVVSGEPGSGKTEWTTVLGANLARLHKLPGAFLQLEDRAARVRDCLVRYAIGNVAQVSSKSDADAWINQWFRTIEPDHNLCEDYSLDWLETIIGEARSRHGCKWLVIDPWNELEHLWDRRQNESTYINDALRRLKRVARAHQIILIVVTHPSKEGAKYRTIDDLDLYTIAGSAAWANKADHGIILHRPDKARANLVVKLAKVRDQSLMGRPGSVEMIYRPSLAQFAPVN